MAKNLNLESLFVAFLCIDHPIVINVSAIRFITGCSIEVNLLVASDMLMESKPNGETKYRIKPTNN
jgi:hypothetical protein